MTDKQSSGKTTQILTIVAVGLLAIIAYQVLIGGSLKKVNILEGEVEFFEQKKDSSPQGVQTNNPAIANESSQNTSNVIARQTTSIGVAYAGDYYSCQLPVTITIGDQSFIPTSNLHTVSNVALGSQSYSIAGQIHCPSIGSCQVEGSGVINVTANRRFNIVWQNVDIGYCTAVLQ